MIQKKLQTQNIHAFDKKDKNTITPYSYIRQFRKGYLTIYRNTNGEAWHCLADYDGSNHTLSR